MFPPSSVSSPAPPSAAAPAETSSLCDRVNVAMSSSKIGRRKKSTESEIQRFALSRDPKNFDPFSAFLQDNWNVRFWHKADISITVANVCFWGKSEHLTSIGHQSAASSLFSIWVRTPYKA
jgi:hypothetical protein